MNVNGHRDSRRSTAATPGLADAGVPPSRPQVVVFGAGSTGFAAGHRPLSHWGIRGHTLHTFGDHGRSPVLPRQATGKV